MKHRRALVFFGLGVFGLPLGACGSSESSSPEGSDDSLTLGQDSAQDLVQPPAAALSAPAPAGATGLLEPLDTSRTDNVVEACAGEAFATERLPLDMFFLVDSSGSMEDGDGSASKWDLIESALVSFLQDPQNSDVGVGISYFPKLEEPSCGTGDPDCLCVPFTPICVRLSGGSCEPADYSIPNVPLSLTSNPAAVERDLSSRRTAGGTPTRAALEGTFQYLEQWRAEHPERRTVVVLATDGDPRGCLGNSPEDVAALAGQAFSGPNPIRTFVIGVGRSLTSLNLVAEAGGTTQAFLTEVDSTLVDDFADALVRIRTSALPCEYAIPETGESGAIDPQQVNVWVTREGSADRTLLPKIALAGNDQCGAGQQGWYYDDPGAPKAVRLCPAACAAAEQQQVEVEFGCATATIR